MIAMSATLNTPVRMGPMPTFRKSTTLPRTSPVLLACPCELEIPAQPSSGPCFPSLGG
jgi:hypothetical protein